MPDDTHDNGQWALLRGVRPGSVEPLAGMLAQLHAAAAASKPGKDCREDIQRAIAVVDAAMGGANA